MTRISISLAFLVFVALIVACHKSNSGGGGGQLPGTYKFLYVTALTQSTSIETGSGLNEKTITYTNYKTIQNAGTVVIAKDSIALKGVAYTADTTVISYLYDNGALTDSFSFPFNVSIPAMNSATKYSVIGSDSIYFQGGSLVSIGGVSNITQPSGGRFSFKGDTLFIISKLNQTSPPQSSGGITLSSSASAVETVVLLKQ